MLTRKHLRIFGLFAAALLAAAIILGTIANGAGATDATCDSGQWTNHDEGCITVGGLTYEAYNENGLAAVYVIPGGQKIDLGGQLEYPDSLGVVAIDGKVYVIANGTDGTYFRAARGGTTDFGPWVKIDSK